MVKSVSIPLRNGSIYTAADGDVIVHTTNDGLIIVDDIMYLRSMRRELYVITRDHGVPLVTVWMKSCLDVCLARNRSRNDRINSSNDDNNASSSYCIDRHSTESIYSIDRRVKLVTDDTILRIHGAFEEPTSEFIFDRHHIVVHSDSGDRCLMIDMGVCACVFVYVCLCVYVCVFVFVLYTTSILLYHSTLDHAFQWIIATKNRLIEEYRSKSIDRQSLVRCSSGSSDVLMLSVTKELDEKLRDVRLAL